MMSKTVPCQQNGKSLPRSSQMQNVAANGVGSTNAGGVGRGTTSNMMSLDPDIARTRSFMQEKIFAIIMQRQVHPVDEQQKQRYKNFAERVEGGLFKFASNKEEYMNLSTLEVRMRNLLKRSTYNNNGRRSSPNDNSSSFSTMIPTPGLTHGENSSSAALSAKSVMHSSVTTEPNTSHKSYINGAIRNGYQSSNANISRSSSVNLSSSCVQRMGTQMIPTPGFNSSKNSQTMRKIESSSNESAMVSPPRQQKLKILQSTSLCASTNPTVQRKPFSDVAMAPNKLQNMNGYLNGSLYSDSPKILHQQQLVQGDSSGTKNSELFVPRSFCGGASSSGSIDLPHLDSSTMQTSQSFSKQNTRGINVQSEKLTCENPLSSMDHSSQIWQRQLNQNLMTNKDGLTTHSTMNLRGAELQSQENQNAPEHGFRSGQNLTQSSHQHHPSSGKCTDIETEGQSHLKAEDNLCALTEQHVKDDFHYRISGQDEAQPNSMAVDGPTACLNVNTRSEVGETGSTSSVLPWGNDSQDTQFKRQQMWLLFLLHARSCTYVEGKCPSGKPCSMAQKLLKHMNGCNAGGTGSVCAFPRCLQTRKLIYHYKRCKESSCPVCGPVRLHGAQINSRSNIGSPPVIAKDSSSTKDGSSKLKPNGRKGEDLDEVVSSKRIKIEHTTSVKQENNVNHSSAVNYNGNFSVMGAQPPHVEAAMIIKQEVKLEISSNKSVNVQDVKSCQRSCKDKVKDDFACLPKPEAHNVEKQMNSSKEDTKTTENLVCPKLGKPKIKGVSLTELFTPDQVKEHILSLRQWVGQSKAKAEKNQAMEHLMSENSCQLCAVERLSFEPPPIYCSLCGIRIKRNAMYYTAGAGETRHYFCIPCYNDSRGDTLTLDGVSVPKHKVEKKKNDEETEEWWVQCDKCEAWQHQICALFNGRRNEGGQAEYTCPNCYITEIEKGDRKPLPQNSVLGAKDLPCTILSDHIEHRLCKRLKQERHERARAQGKAFDEVPTADSFVVRVVSSVDKKLDVKPRFLDIFREDNYPTEFPYKSKVILLFQNIEGVEVCLFGMYVQEFGTDSQCPNQRRVYLSYLDSVKYFRPDIKTVHGEALRTFVYHEILIGYLEYCKKRGFTNCYIWACPPLKGEDYILYCHPEIQKTPKSDKLREWYLSMLKKASKEDIVVDLTNLYDHFFVSTGECRAKVTAARLPYFDGDYWPGAAEDLIYQFNQEDDGKKQNKKASGKKTITKRTLKSSELSNTASKDLLLMQKLGETISPMKEDFIMVHLQHCCTHCCNLMVSGQRWVCKQCKKFQLCDKCYDEEQKRDDREQHPINQREKHTLHSVEISGVPEDTKDVDEILESEFFDTRQAFLSLCQGNHYQYDTLRRAKHSSMMILYHLHNPTAPAFVTSCNACHLDIETGQGWRCEVCPDYDICNACYSKDGGISHPHKLTNHLSLAENDDQNKEARQLRVLQLRKMLGLLVHAAQCRSATCPYPNCRKVKGLFRHGFQCRVRATGGCVLCKKMWYLLQLHARACKEKDCNVPRCKDLKEHVRRLQQQSDSRRRAAVMEMMRQRAAEVSGT